MKLVIPQLRNENVIPALQFHADAVASLFSVQTPFDWCEH